MGEHIGELEAEAEDMDIVDDTPLPLLGDVPDPPPLALTPPPPPVLRGVGLSQAEEDDRPWLPPPGE